VVVVFFYQMIVLCIISQCPVKFVFMQGSRGDKGNHEYKYRKNCFCPLGSSTDSKESLAISTSIRADGK